MKELREAITTKLNGDSVLSTLVDSDVYFDSVPNDADVDMPWITFHLISGSRGRVFEDAGCYEEAIMQFSACDQNQNVATCGQMMSDLKVVLDRTSLSYTNHTHVGCMREGETGPTFHPDNGVWMGTVDYRITWQP